MTLSTQASRISYFGDGATKTFPIPFKIWAGSNLGVYVRDLALVDTKAVLNVDYTIDIVTFPNTGNVVFVNAPAAGAFVILQREMPLTQELDLIATGDFAAENIETQLDKFAAELQTIRDRLERTPALPVGTQIYNPALPNLGAAQAGAILGVSGDGFNFAYYAGATPPSVPVTPFAATLLNDATALEARTTLGLLRAQATLDFASTADNAVSPAINVTVTGARPGDFAIARAVSGTIATTLGVTLAASVISNDTVAVSLINDSGGVFDAVSQLVNVLVIAY